jgi:hypothetical protein
MVTATQARFSPTPRMRNAAHPFSTSPVRTLKFSPQNPARKEIGRKMVASQAHPPAGQLQSFGRWLVGQGVLGAGTGARVQIRSRSADRAVPQTAAIPLATRHYTSALLNFAKHSPEDSQRDINTVLRAVGRSDQRDRSRTERLCARLSARGQLRIVNSRTI